MLVGISIGVTLVLVGVALLTINLLRRRRALRPADSQIQQEVVEHLARTFPTLSVAENAPGVIRLRNASGAEATMHMDNLIPAVRASRGRPGDRARIYQEFINPLARYAGVAEVRPLSSQTERIMPRLVHRDYIESMSGSGPIHKRLGETPLHVAYVLDEGSSVRFLVESDLSELGIDVERLDELAKANFRPRLPEKAFRDIMDRSGKATIISEGDSYDATRLLLILERLAPGRVVAAAVPDRDTLVVVPDPGEEAWPTLERVAATPRSSRVMLPRPLRLTSLGIEVR